MLAGPASISFGSTGGGFAAGGLRGEYFDDRGGEHFAGGPVFVRKEPRIDFDWGAHDRFYPSITGTVSYTLPARNFSARWTGQLVARFSESYTFRARSSGALRLLLRPAGQAAWTTVIDHFDPHDVAEKSSTFGLEAGRPYDVRVDYVQGEGAAVARLWWSSPSTPEEVVDSICQTGINNPDGSAAFRDIVKCARNSWSGVDGGQEPPLDGEGWPLGDCSYTFQESLNQGLDLDPLMRGMIFFRFRGRADVAIQGNVDVKSLRSRYDPATNATIGLFLARNNGWNASYIHFRKARRGPRDADPRGFTDLALMRPTAPDARTVFDPRSPEIFTPHIKAAMEHFSLIRFQLVASQEKDWADRTTPAYYNQAGGRVTPPRYGIGKPTANGWSWEYKVMLANETGRDLMISIPTVATGRTPADTQSYLVKLARLLRHGSDGVEPYDSPQERPAYPPLNPNLRVYLELENELWNWAGVFNTDWANLNALVAEDIAAGHPDFSLVNFDDLSLERDRNGSYKNIEAWRYRKIMLRMRQVSDIFRVVFGDAEMHTRVRPLYMWQYDNVNDTARRAITWADRVLNNGDGVAHVRDPRPVSWWLWGGGGATYYGARNGNGLTDLLPDPRFERPALARPGLQPAPGGSAYRFAGTAGLARTDEAAGVPPGVASSSQMAFITDKGALAFEVRFPAHPTSNVYGVSFKALNRRKPGSVGPDSQNLRLFLDDRMDITAKTFNQGDGYAPEGYDKGRPWVARNVFWSNSEYYASRSFEVAPGSTHRITIRGMGQRGKSPAADQTAFVGEVRVTSVDRIFEDGIPGGGEAAGQPAGQRIQRVMDVEASWARAFGLEALAYESGWSLGGDDGGSWVQLKAKYGDPRTRVAQEQFLGFFARSGGAVDVFGTYAQWPNWSDFYAEQGLIEPGRYPIVQGIDAAMARLPAEPTNGNPIPDRLRPAQSTLAHAADSKAGTISEAGGWISWNVLVPMTGAFEVRADTRGVAGRAVLLADDRPIAEGPVGGPLAGTARLTRGLHSVKVRGIAPTPFAVASLDVLQPDAPDAPGGLALEDRAAEVTARWLPVPGAVAYRLMHGGTTAASDEATEVPSARTEATITHLSTVDPRFFRVAARDGQGRLGPPSPARSAIPLATGQVGILAGWDVTGRDGSDPELEPTSSSRVVASTLKRGPGLKPTRWNGNGDGYFAAGSTAWARDAEEAAAKSQWFEFTLAPAPGRSLDLERVTLALMIQNAKAGKNRVAAALSREGAPFKPAPVTASVSGSVVPVTIELRAMPEARGLRGPFTIRIYACGNGPYEAVAVAGVSQQENDVVVRGAVTDTAVVEVGPEPGPPANAPTRPR